MWVLPSGCLSDRTDVVTSSFKFNLLSILRTCTYLCQFQTQLTDMTKSEM